MRSRRTCRVASCALLLAMAVFILGGRGRAQMTSAEINRGVWKHIFAVTDAQLNDPAWLAADDDGDGISNENEIASGTDPFSSGSAIQISKMTVDESGVHLTFGTTKGKQYVLQKKASLATAVNWQAVSPAVSVMGNNAVRTVTTPFVANTFYRVLVQDVDSDGDGSSDWAEVNLGLDPQNSHSNNQIDAFGRPLTDSEYAATHLSQENVVTIAAEVPGAGAEQPESGAAANVPAFKVMRSGLPEFLKVLTVRIVVGGTAVPGVDYTALASTVTMPAGIRSVRVPVVPLSNQANHAPVTVTLSLQGGPGYAMGAAQAAVVFLGPTSAPHGTGLTGTYYTGYNSTYTSAANFAGTANSRIDATVDFKWSTAAPPAASYTNPLGITTGGTAYTIRWTGQVQPQYSETYWFVTRVDDGAVLKINPTTINNQTTGAGVGQVIINSWSNRSSAGDVTSTPIELKGGVRYNIQLDYYSKAALGETHLSWYSPSQVKQIIPQSRLYSSLAGDAAAPPVLTSEPVLYGYVGQPFDSTLLASNSPTGFALQFGTMPPGVTLSSAGILSGTPTVAGEYPLTVRISNSGGTSDAVVTIEVLDTGNGITREVWKNLPANSAIASIPVDTPPSISSTLTSFEDLDKTYGNNYGERVRGYITVKDTGNYYFWVSANDSAELWISNDQERVSRVRRAVISNGGSTARQWDQQAKQRSGWINLIAGRKYYLEVLHKGLSSAAHNLSVGWTRDLTGTSAPIANGTGVVPGYMLWKYYATDAYATAGSAAGSLFYTKLGPQGLSVTNGSGLATLRLSDDQLHAILAYNYNGLSSEVVAKHLHADAYLNKPAGPIIFDIDAATPQADGSYVWDLTPVGVYSLADLQQIVLQGKCYLNIHTVNYPAGEIRGNFSLANGAQTFVPPAEPPTLPAGAPTVEQASRFLTQATFGPSAADLSSVMSRGYRPWLDGQLSLPATKHSPLVVKQANAGTPWPSSMTFNAWWNRSITAPDQLRQRMAFALSEILVISDVGPLNDRANALSDYYDLLLDYSFGNFRDVLREVTLHPAMGVYLDMRGNNKGDIPTGRHANENYAREIMQLFSVGLNRLWPDGSVVLNSNFGLVPTYDQDVINGVATVFTGWTYAQPRQANGRLSTNFYPSSNYTDQMMLVPRNHDLGPKRILDNVFLPVPPAADLSEGTTETDLNFTYTDAQGAATAENAYDANGLRDLDAFVEALFNHPNVGPFICRQLIQRLVTSNPSAGYLYRVVRAFNGERNVDGNATGVRGDLKEVLRAILLDYEARSPAMLADPIFGKQREPVLRVTAPARYLAAGPAIAATFNQSANADANLGRIIVTLPTGTTIPLGTSDSLNLQFGTLTTGTVPPYSSSAASAKYDVRSSIVTGSGASAVQTITVDALGQYRGTYAQSGTVVTVSAVDHRLRAGGSLYLKFAPGTGGAAEDGVYMVQSVPDANSFTINRTTAATITGAPGCLLHRITSGGINADDSKITIYTTIPHRLVAGDNVTIFANGKLDGSNTSVVATVPTPTSFTVSNFAAPDTLASQTGGSITIFPQIPMELTRSGPVTLNRSTWSVGITDGESTSVSVTQTPLRSPTVFNYFSPDYKAPGAIAEKGFTTPEFQLTSEANTMALTNYLSRGFFNGSTSGYPDGRASFRDGNEAILMDLSGLMAFKVASGLPALVDKLNQEMMGGNMPPATRQAILDYVANPTYFPANSATLARDQVRAVVHLIITSAEYAIQR